MYTCNAMIVCKKLEKPGITSLAGNTPKKHGYLECEAIKQICLTASTSNNYLN